MGDLELHSLAIGLETNSRERFVADYQNREHIEPVGCLVVRRTSRCNVTSASPLHHFGHNHQTEVVHRTYFTVQGCTTGCVLLHGDEGRVVVQVLHGLERGQQFRANVGNTARRNGAGVHHASASDGSRVLGRAVVVQINGQVHQIAVAHQIASAHGSGGSSITCVLHNTGCIDQVNLQSVFSDFVSTGQHFTVNVLQQISVGIEVQRFLGVLIEEAELLQSTFNFLALETNTVHSTAGFRQHRQLAGNGANVLRRAIQVAVDSGYTSSVNTLIVDVGVIQQRQVVVTLDLLAHVLGHGSHISELTEVLLLGNFDQSFLLIELIGDLWANARRSGWGVLKLLAHICPLSESNFCKFGKLFV